jgi:hypothetical protein
MTKGKEQEARGDKHAKSLTRQLEGSQITQAVSVDITPTKNIN